MINAGRRTNVDIVGNIMKQAENLRDAGTDARKKSFETTQLYKDIHKNKVVFQKEEQK